MQVHFLDKITISLKINNLSNLTLFYIAIYFCQEKLTKNPYKVLTFRKIFLIRKDLLHSFNLLFMIFAFNNFKSNIWYSIFLYIQYQCKRTISLVPEITVFFLLDCHLNNKLFNGGDVKATIYSFGCNGLCLFI